MKKKQRKWFGKLVITFLLLLLTVAFRYLYLVTQQIKEVNKWRETVSATAEQYGVSEYEDIILAIILTETKGDHIDLMQSSESKYGEKNQIATTDESIQLGVEHLAKVMEQSTQAEVDVWTGVQAYNFGANYIPYIAANGGKNTVTLAEKYSKEVLAPLLGNLTNQQYRYLTFRGIKYNGGYLYQNGGNFFYADIVQWNLTLLRAFQSLPFS